MERTNNYQIQAGQAKQLFLTYDQQELIDRCRLSCDDAYFYTKMLGEPYRICRTSGDMERLHRGQWVDANSFNEVMTLLDWLCDSRADRYITGQWENMLSFGLQFHQNLLEDGKDPDAVRIDREPEAFMRACEVLGGEKLPGADLGYAIELLDGLRIFVQFWHGDEEFAPRLRYLWDRNANRYIRYETMYFAVNLLLQRIRENMA